MHHQVLRRAAGTAAVVAATTLFIAGCSDDDGDATGASSSVSAEVAGGGSGSAADASASGAAGEVELTAADGTAVKLTGPIAAKYQAATDAQKSDLGKPSSGADAAGTSDSGVVFQQFDGGVITAKNGEAGTPAYITWGKIRDAWNVKRDESGAPAQDGKGGSDGPLGAATSDETENGDLKESTFEHGKVTYDTKADKVEVTVNGVVVP